MHKSHISHLDDVRQSHFSEPCEIGTTEAMSIAPSEIIARLKALNVPHERVADAINRDRTVATKLMNGARSMKVSEIAPLEELLRQFEGASAMTPSVQPAPMPTVSPGQWTRDVPVVGGGLAAPLHIVKSGAHLDIEQTSLDFGADPDFAPRPPAFATNRQLYCVYVWGDSMVPRFDAGDRLYVDPRRPPNVGDDVVVQLRGDPGGDESQVVVALIKRLARRNGSTIELEQYNPATSIVVETSRVAAIHRIVPWREML